MASQIIISHKDDLFELESDDTDMLHYTLSKLLEKPPDFERLIPEAVQLYQQHPPESLPNRAWRQISSYSVLKTTRDATKLTQQTLAEGEKWLAKQAAELRRQQQMVAAGSALWRMRRPTGAVGVALIAALISWWIRRDGFPGILMAVWQSVKSWFW